MRERGAGANEFAAEGGVQAGAEGEHGGVGKRGRQQGDAEREPVGAKAGGDGDAAEVEQVDEVRVGAEAGVVEQGLGGELGVGVDGGRGGQEENVDSRPGGRGGAAEFLEFIEGAEGIDGVEAVRSADDFGGDGCRASGCSCAKGVMAARRSATQGPE